MQDQYIPTQWAWPDALKLYRTEGQQIQNTRNSDRRLCPTKQRAEEASWSPANVTMLRCSPSIDPIPCLARDCFWQAGATPSRACNYVVALAPEQKCGPTRVASQHDIRSKHLSRSFITTPHAAARSHPPNPKKTWPTLGKRNAKSRSTLSPFILTMATERNMSGEMATWRCADVHTSKPSAPK